MEDTTFSKRMTNRESFMLTPPTPAVNSFSRFSNLDGTAATCPDDQTISSRSTIRVTPPSTASPMKRSRDSVSPEHQELKHDGITSFDTADPPLTNLLPAAPPPQFPSQLPQQEQRSLSSSSSSSSSTGGSSRRSPSPGYQNNTIVDTIRELGGLKYLQAVNDPRFLPARLRPKPANPEPAARPSRKPTKANKKKPALTHSENTKRRSVAINQAPAEKKRKWSNVDITTADAVTSEAPKTRAKLSGPEVKAKPSVDPSKGTSPTTGKKRRVSEVASGLAQSASSSKRHQSEDATPATEQESPVKRSKTMPPTSISTKSTPAKPRNRKTPKKTTSVGTGKPEKSRTKEQRWGDHLKSIVGGEKDVYQKLPDLALPPLGHLIDHAPIRPYMFNKGKVQDYGNGAGLHVREMELAREVGLSYDAYRQQKRMAFIGYAAMQLEGKKEFKKSHTQSMCNIDGNKATHLWVHFHDVWGWMPEQPTPPVTRASLGGLQLPELHVA